MQQMDYRITTEFIELNQLLKICGLAASGGAGGALVTEGNVTVDGQQELRKRCKIRPGQVVQLGDMRITVLAPDPTEVAALAEARVVQAREKAAKKRAAKVSAPWAPPRTGAKPGPKARSKQMAKPAPKPKVPSLDAGGTPMPATSKGPKQNVFAAKAEAHRQRRKP